MFFYSLILTVFFIILLNCNDKHPRYKVFSLATVSTILILIIGLRHYELGLNDTKMVYIPEFKKILKLEMIDVFKSFKDPIFYCLTKLYSFLSTNIQIWLLICAAAYIVPVMKIIKEESPIVIVSVFVFIALNFFGMGFSGVRHCIALGILLNCFDALNKENYKRFIIVVLIASMFHVSALIMFLIYPVLKIIKILNNKKFIHSLYIILIIYAINMFVGRQIIDGCIDFIVNVLKMERFKVYFVKNHTTLTSTSFYINALMYIFIGSLLSNNSNRRNSILISFQFIATVLTMFVPIFGEFYRLSMFFSIFLILSLPEAIKQFKSKDTVLIVTLLLVFVFALYFLFFSAKNNGIIPYKIFYVN